MIERPLTPSRSPLRASRASPHTHINVPAGFPVDPSIIISGFACELQGDPKYLSSCHWDRNYAFYFARALRWCFCESCSAPPPPKKKQCLRVLPISPLRQARWGTHSGASESLVILGCCWCWVNIIPGVSKDRSAFFFRNVMLYRQINIYRRFGRRAFTWGHRQTNLPALHDLPMKMKALHLPKRPALLATRHDVTSPAIWTVIRPANLIAFSSLREGFLAIWLPAWGSGQPHQSFRWDVT